MGQPKTNQMEKILKRADGSRVKVVVVFEKTYSVNVWTCDKGKRTFKIVDPTDEYQYRRLPFGGKEREIFWMNAKLDHCTIQEIQEIATELWHANKPNFLEWKKNL